MTKVCPLEALAHTQILVCQAAPGRQCSPTSEMGRLGAARGQSAPKCQEGVRGHRPTDVPELGCGRGTVPAGPLCALISSSMKTGRST